MLQTSDAKQADLSQEDPPPNLDRALALLDQEVLCWAQSIMLSPAEESFVRLSNAWLLLNGLGSFPHAAKIFSRCADEGLEIPIAE